MRWAIPFLAARVDACFWKWHAVRPVADQLLVRTGEMARRQEEEPPNLLRKILGAVARYQPSLSGMRLL